METPTTTHDQPQYHAAACLFIAYIVHVESPAGVVKELGNHIA